MADLVVNPIIEENPKYRTICGNHVTSVTKFICYLSIVGLCLSSLGSFPFGLIFTLPMIYIFYIALKGIEELRSGKLQPLLILSGIELVVIIGVSIYAFGSIVLGGHTTGLYDEPYIYIAFFVFWIKVLWNIWCFVVVLRCYEYVKNMKMAQTNKTEVV